MPERIQRKRVKGWRMPTGAVYVGRPTAYGNPFTAAGYLEHWNPKATPDEVRRGCVGMFRDWLRERLSGVWDSSYPGTREKWRALLAALRGKDLACWCPVGSPCHADVLLEIANAGG